MKQKKLNLGVLLLGLGLTAQAQQAATTTGGDATGSGGTVAYSVGLVVHTTNTGAAGSLAQGVQQAYEISIVSTFEDQPSSLDLRVYPNPTIDQLSLHVGNIELSNLSFQLFDLNGKLIASKKIALETETIQMEALPSGVYFLNVTHKTKALKTFKIIKY